MAVPFVIDNQTHRLADVLTEVLQGHGGRSLDVATAYFTIGGFALLREGLGPLGSTRLLLGAEPTSGAEIGLRPDDERVKRLIRCDLDAAPFDEGMLRAAEDLIAFLSRESVGVRLHRAGFLHAKCWLFYADRPGQQMLFDRFRPIVAIVGSSNFTAPGLTSNRELNLAHKVLLEPGEVEDPEAAYAVRWLSDAKPPERITVEDRKLVKSEVGSRAIIELERWYERQWQDGVDFKPALIELLDASKFGRTEYTPFQVYLKALYEYFREDLEKVPAGPMRSAVELAEFQEDAVRKARRILARFDGTMVADSVGLGKTWIGKKLLEDFAYHQRQKALVVCPASLREMWERELLDATISANIVSQEELGRDEFDPRPYADVDVVLVDECHNFRNPLANRSVNLATVLKSNGERGRDGLRKKVILLTATPINNDLFDLYHQLSLITLGHRDHFAGCGIGDLPRYFRQARRASRSGDGAVALFNLLEEVVIRRTRSFIRKAYPEATIRGERIRFPHRRLRTIKYDLEATYAGIYDEIVSGVESLKLAPYNLESFKKAGVAVDEMEAGRGQALVGIFKSRYLKRFESSVEAFRISVRRALAYLKTFESYVLDGKVLRSAEFHKALRFLESEDEEDDATPRSVAEELDATEEAQVILRNLQTVDPGQYDLRRLHDAVQHDIDTLTAIWERVRRIGPADDSKLAELRRLLTGELLGQKVLLFTYYKDTARYLYRQLGHPESEAAREFREKAGGALVRRMDSGADTRERLRLVQEFAPRSNGRPDLAGSEREVQILVSTDVLSEGQNLQDCGVLVNYDLHWNPTRMVQRAGRIDRIGSPFDELLVCNMFPDEGLERLLGLVASLSEKIAGIDSAGFLDASVLGEVVHPRNFNTLKRISEEDGSVLDEEERFADLVSSEFMLQQLRTALDSQGSAAVEDLPDGIHSGLAHPGQAGAFFYFKAGRDTERTQHFWRFVDARNDAVLDNRYLLGSLIACDETTPRMVDPALKERAFELQERAIASIIESVERQKALEAAPRAIEPTQQAIASFLQSNLNNPAVDRQRAIAAIRFVSQPMLPGQLQGIRALSKELSSDADPSPVIQALDEMRSELGDTSTTGAGGASPTARPQLSRDDLHLVCFDFIGG